MNTENYRAYLQKVYIEPIRSVLIVDDEYPTLDEILSLADGTQNLEVKKQWPKRAADVRRVISALRGDNNSRILDICDDIPLEEDGTIVKVRHLHQSDLLVLDYDMNKDEGRKAIQALKSVLSNKQFNLVALHSSGEPERIFRSVLTAVLPASKDFGTEDENQAALELIWDGDDGEALEVRISETIGLDQYFFCRKHKSQLAEKLALAGGPLAQFKGICEEQRWTPDQSLQVLNQLLTRHDEKLSEGVASLSLTWSDRAPFWIGSKEAFIAFVPKASANGAQVEIESKLVDALASWAPNPSQMLFSLLRSAIDDVGIEAELGVAKESFVHAHWFANILERYGNGRKTSIEGTISRYFERLQDIVSPGASDVLEEIAEQYWNSEEEKAFQEDFDKSNKDQRRELIAKKKKTIFGKIKEIYAVDLTIDEQRKLSEKYHNLYVSTKKPSGWHLDTGHIFKANGYVWVCLSPACDMAPHHRDSTDGHLGEAGQLKPFVAVRLQKATAKLSSIQSNIFLFIKEKGNVQAYGFNNPASPNNSNPHWYPLYAENFGMLDKMKFKVHLPDFTQENAVVSFMHHEAEIVGQLRYEYALNLVQKLGIAQGRVGLDFAG